MELRTGHHEIVMRGLMGMMKGCRCGLMGMMKNCRRGLMSIMKI